MRLELVDVETVGLHPDGHDPHARHEVEDAEEQREDRIVDDDRVPWIQGAEHREGEAVDAAAGDDDPLG